MFRAIIEASRLTFRQPARAWLMARMAAWVTALSFLVRVCPLPRALQLVSTSTRSKQKRHAATSEELSTAIDAVLGMNFLIFKPNCWKRAAVLHRYLALKGASTTIVFGLRKEPAGELKGHAWLEYEGRPILEPSPPSYKVTYKFPSADSFDGELALMAGAHQ